MNATTEASHVVWRAATMGDAVVRVDKQTWRSAEEMALYFGPSSVQPMRQRHVWAQYNAAGQRTSQGQHDMAPTDAELAEWDAQALEQAARFTRATGLPDDLYIRFNRLPRGGQSRNHATGEYEAGVSVYRATYNRLTERIAFDEDGTTGGAAFSYVGTGVPIYLLTGEEIGRGSDGEPLLQAPHVLGRLSYDRERGGFRLTRTGKRGQA